MIGQSIVVLDETLMSVFGDLSGDGAQTHLQYARRTMFVPVGVIAQAAAVAAYPFLARLFAAGRESAMADAVDRALRWVLALSIAAAALVASLSVPIIRVLFERFEFTPADTTATAAGLFFFALAIPIWGVLQVLTRAFYARGEMWTPVALGTRRDRRCLNRCTGRCSAALACEVSPRRVCSRWVPTPLPSPWPGIDGRITLAALVAFSIRQGGPSSQLR